jgi:UPF0176 protein
MVSPPPLCHIAFHRFVALSDPARTAGCLRELARGLLGSVLVAREGINGVLAGPPAVLDSFEAALARDARLDGHFAGMAFKRSACASAPFARLKVHVKPMLVAVGTPGEAPFRPGGTAVGPQAWRALIAQEDVVVLDNRNSFEYRLGHFARAVDPGVSHFRDFPAYIQAHAPAWRAAGRRVAMYCTGGIRCEKTAAWMQDLGLDVYQLDGGILHYFQSMPDASADWQGECFVFDNRVALDTRLQETGTTPEQVYGGLPDAAWRLQRARRLDAAA